MEVAMRERMLSMRATLFLRWNLVRRPFAGTNASPEIVVEQVAADEQDRFRSRVGSLIGSVRLHGLFTDEATPG